MGFDGGGYNIAIATAEHQSSLYCIVNIKQFMEFFISFFYACLRIRFLDVKTNPGPRHPDSAVCLTGNLSDLTGTSPQYDTLLYPETLVSDMHNVSELLVPGFGNHVLLCRGKLPRARRVAAYKGVGCGAFR